MKYVSLNDLKVIEVSHNPRIKKRQMLSMGELGPVTIFSQAVFPPGEIAYGHHHKDMGEVFFCQSGKGIININGTEYDLAPGVCVAVEPFEEHEISNIGENDLILTYFGVRMP
jgi:mannose-6-phosphate isomerase-like protein (cupin superfamily)